MRADIRKLWAGQAVSEIGSRISREGLPLTAVLILGANAVNMGLLLALNAATLLAFSLIAGVWADRVRKRPLMISADLARALLLASIPLAAATHTLSLAQIYFVMALNGVFTVFFDVAYQALVPVLVNAQELLQVNSRLAATSATAELVGPALTGVLVQLITAPISILLDAISFLFSAATIAWIRKPEPPPSAAPRQSFWPEARAGIHFVFRQPQLRALARWSLSASLFHSLTGSVYVLYAIRELHLNPAQLGVVIAMGGVGGLLGSFLSARIVAAFGLGPTFIACTLGLPVALAMIALAHGPALVAMLFLMTQQLLGDLSFTVYTISELTLRQRLAPPEMLGRVSAAMTLLMRGMYPVGLAAGGLLANAAGMRAVLWLSAVGVFLSAAWLIFSPVRSSTAVA